MHVRKGFKTLVAILDYKARITTLQGMDISLPRVEVQSTLQLVSDRREGPAPTLGGEMKITLGNLLLRFHYVCTAIVRRQQKSNVIAHVHILNVFVYASAVSYITLLLFLSNYAKMFKIYKFSVLTNNSQQSITNSTNSVRAREHFKVWWGHL